MSVRRVASIPSDWVKIQHKHARKMLAEEQATLRDLRDDVNEAVDDATLAIARRTDRQSNASKAAILAMLLLSADRLRTRSARTIRASIGSARRQGLERLTEEWGLAQATTRLPAIPAAAKNIKSHADAVHASAAADSLAAQWKSSSVYRVNAALLEGRSPERALSGTSNLVDGRLRRIASTEVPRAYNDEHRQASEEAIQYAKDAGADVAMIVRRWDAMLDARTCSVCRGHDGEVVRLGQSFEGGDEPGMVHGSCRCMDSLVALPGWNS